jgi:tetratricopeptide (TPR) repeat protein
MLDTGSRRRIARIVLAVLVLAHLAAFGAYVLRERQSQLLTLYLDARDQWREGHLEVAARAYATFVAERPAVAWPVVLFRNFPDAASGWYALGRVETDRGHVDAALAAYRQAMQLAPGRGRREYRDLLLRSGRGAMLVSFATEEGRTEPDSPIAAKDLGAGLLATGQPAAAATAYRRALALLPAWQLRRDPGAPAGLSGEEADLLNLLSVAERLAGQPERADAACARITRAAHGSVRLDRLCGAYRFAAAGDRPAALQALAGYLPPAPEHEALLRALQPPQD